MPYVIERHPEVFEEVAGSFQSGSGEEALNHPEGWLEAAAQEELADARVSFVDPAPVPNGLTVVATRYERVAGVVTQILALEPAKIVVPQSVTPRQLRLALLGADKLDQVEAFVSSGHAPKAAVISWEYATEFLRSDPMLNQLAAMLQPPLGDTEIDRLFVAAAQIQ